MTLPHTNTLARFSWLALLFGLLITSLATWQVKQVSEHNAIKDFEFISQQITTTVEERLAAYALVLRGAAGLFSASSHVSRSEWESYVSQLQLVKSLSGISGINFAQALSPDQLAAHMETLGFGAKRAVRKKSNIGHND